MKRTISFGTCIILMLMVAICTYQMTAISKDAEFEGILSSIVTTPSDNPKLAEIKYYIDEYFVKDYDEDYLSDATAMGLVYGLRDPHSTYYTKEDFKKTVANREGTMTGIGIRVFYVQDTEEMQLYEVMENSPAHNAGLQRGDVIYAIDDVSYEVLGYEGSYNAIVGEAGTDVKISVVREGEILNFVITRSEFTQQSVTYRLCDTDKTIGYVKIHSFDNATANQFKDAVKTLIESGVRSFIFDVRNNPGGLLTSVAEVLDYLLPAGPIIRMQDKNEKTEMLNSDSSEISFPMVVIANSSSASAAELFTSALMDYDKATFIGTKTYGKGTVQSTFTLSDNSAVHLSTQYYLPPFSPSFDGVGIIPDIEVVLSEEEEKNFFMLSETEDPQLYQAITYLKQ